MHGYFRYVCEQIVAFEKLLTMCFSICLYKFRIVKKTRLHICQTKVKDTNLAYYSENISGKYIHTILHIKY